MRDEGLQAREIAAAVAPGHTARVERFRERLLDAYASISPRSGHVPFYSTVTGGLLDTAELGAEYWYRNLRETVQFAGTVRELLREEPRTVVEIGPHPVLAMAVQETVEDVLGGSGDVGTVGSLRRGEGGVERFLTSLAEVWVRGGEVDWSAVFRGSVAHLVGLPTYAFQRRRYWVQSAITGDGAAPGAPPDVPAEEALDAAAGESLARRVAAASESEREQLVLEAVRERIASVLGYDSAEEIDPEQALLELGFDSLTALELRNRLRIVSGLELPATLLFDHPTPAALTARLLSGLARAGRRRRARGWCGRRASRSAPSPRSCVQAGSGGELGEFMELLTTASRFRPTFDARSDSVEAPKPLRLATGAGHPNLVCFPTVLATADPYQYAKFAHGFRGERDVTAQPLVGFADGERLPASMCDAAAAHAEAIRELAIDAPCVLAGYSAGGVMAYAVAGHLERIGVPLAGVVLLDTLAFARDALVEIMGNVTWAMLAREDVQMTVSDARLTAMAAYGGLLADWEPIAVTAPTLALRADAVTPEVSAELEWGAAWDLARETVAVPGNHITLMEEHVGSTVQAVRQWLLSLTTHMGGDD